MTTEKNPVVELQRILNDALEEIEELSEEELTQLYIEEGKSSKAVAEDTRNILMSAVLSYGKRKYAEAKVLEHQSVQSSEKIPETPEERRSLFCSIIQNNPQAGSFVTCQYRNYRDLTDEEIQMYLEQFIELEINIYDDGQEQ